MNVRTTMLGLVAGVAAIALAKMLWERSQTTSNARRLAEAAGKAPVLAIIEETLHDHQGEESPFMQAFEKALEQETRLEEQLAHENGLRV